MTLVNFTAMRIPSLLIAIPLFVASSTGQTFPALKGETATGENISLPKSKAKDWTIVGIAFSQKASSHLETWYEPAYLRFIAQHGLMAGAYEADIYFVPLFVGINKAAYEPTLKNFRKSADPEIVGHVLFSKEDAEPLIAELGMTDKDTPYFFILDANGKIVHRTNGVFTEDKLEAMEDVMLE